MSINILKRFPVNSPQLNLSKCLSLKYIAGTPVLVLLPSMMLEAFGGGSSTLARA